MAMPMLRRLRAVRESKYLSQAELSERSGVGKANIARLEQGKQSPQPRTIRRLADALGVEPAALVDGGTEDDPML